MIRLTEVLYSRGLFYFKNAIQMGLYDMLARETVHFQVE